MTSPPPPAKGRARVRMSAAERQEQLLEIARELFAEKGYEGTAMEEIAARAGVSKPVVYEHFGGKEGCYAVVVDREVQRLHSAIQEAISAPGASARELLERGAMALLTYIEERPDGFRILSRDTSGQGGSIATILSDIGVQVEDLLAEQFEQTGHDPQFAGLYAHALVGLVAMTGQQWVDRGSEPSREIVVTHLVNLAWYGMSRLQADPRLMMDVVDRRSQERTQPHPDPSG